MTHGSALAHPAAQARGGQDDDAADGVTGLMAASRDSEPWKLDQLFASGADVNAKDKYGWTALTYAAVKGDLTILQALLAKNADPNVKDEIGYTPLMYAAEEGHPDEVKTLLRSSPDINAASSRGETALSIALRKGRADVVEILRQAGAVEGKLRDSGGDASAYVFSNPHLDKKPSMRNSPHPQYTPEARGNKVNGVVRLRALVGADGKVEKVRLLSGLPYGLSAEARKEGYKVRFSPPLRDRRPTEVWVPLDIEFQVK